ncbi:MAG TPA: PadR family transcriptional regulator [Symbiobacteriaceae bacterium]
MMAKEKDLLIADWDAEERRLQDEYRQRLAELKATRETSEIVGQVLTRGLLPLYVLHLLASRPHNGSEICTSIGTRTEGAWQPSTGGIYPLLRKFEKQGLVEGNWEDPNKRTQRLYTLTSKGAAELQSLRQGMKSKMQRAFRVFEIVLADLFGPAAPQETPAAPQETPAKPGSEERSGAQ